MKWVTLWTGPEDSDTNFLFVSQIHKEVTNKTISRFIRINKDNQDNGGRVDWWFIRYIYRPKLSPQTGRTATITAASAIVASHVGPHVVQHPGQANGQ